MKRYTLSGVLLLAVGGALIIGPSAGAATPVVSTQGKYCAYFAPTGAMACVDDQADFSLALQTALGQPVSPGVGLGQSYRPAGAYALGVFYDNARFDASAGTITWFDNHDCTTTLSDVDSGWSDTTTWRHRISSFKGLSNCFIRPWSETNYSGATLPGFVYQKSSLGVLNDHVWSVQFS